MSLQPGEQIGAYRIIAPLGQGGTATVYRAFHARLNRFVAIKMIHQAYAGDASFLARFEREAQIIAGLEHPHIVPVYDFSEHAGEPYLVLKLIEGSTLKERISKAPLTEDEILAIMTPIAAALDYAHECGVLHRDIKPSNIILDRIGTPFLTDFGLARSALVDESTLSQDMMLGTPHYISPEQALGKGEVDTRSDLYSFGVVLYELLVGKVPFSGGTPYSIINDHIYRPLPLPSDVKPSISPAVEAVLLKALAKEREDRYSSATALVAALKDALENPLEPEVNESDTQQFVVPSFTVSSSTPAAAVQTEATPTRAALPAKKSRRKLWLWLGWVIAMGTAGGLAAAVVSLLIIVPNRLNNLPPPPPAVLAAYSVPELTHDEAQAAIAANPEDPAGYLALVRVQLEANDLRGIRRTMSEGLQSVADAARFELAAATLAMESGHPDAAFVIYANALAAAEGTPQFATVRASAGEAMYKLAAEGDRLRPAQVVALNAELESLSSPLVKAMIARAMQRSENTRLAQLNINAALNGDNTLAEAHLVNGELAQARNADTARHEWQTARDAPDAPAWVRDRATELLATLT